MISPLDRVRGKMKAVFRSFHPRGAELGLAEATYRSAVLDLCFGSLGDAGLTYQFEGEALVGEGTHR